MGHDAGTSDYTGLRLLQAKASLYTITSTLRRYARATRNKWKAEAEERVRRAWRERDFATAHRTTAQLSATGIGVKNRIYNDVPGYRPSLQ